MMILQTHRFTIGRFCAIAVGLVFLVAGTAKLLDPTQFYWHTLYQMLYMNPRRLFNLVSIGPYGRSLLWEAAAHGATIFLIPLELILAVALLTNHRPSVSLPVTGAFLLLFIEITAYASFRGVESDCGCFGGLFERTPVETIIEDLVLLAATGIAWWGHSSQAYLSQAFQRRLIVWTGVGAFVLNALLLFSAKPYWHGSDLRVGGHIQNMHAEEVVTDLHQGEHLLVFFSTECPQCQFVVPQLNALADQAGMPSLIGLSTNTVEQRRAFRERFRPHYPTGYLDELEMHQLMWTHKVPYLIYVRNGMIQQVWEGHALPEPIAVQSLSRSLSLRSL